jgi:hypothetical protein
MTQTEDTPPTSQLIGVLVLIYTKLRLTITRAVTREKEYICQSCYSVHGGGKSATKNNTADTDPYRPPIRATPSDDTELVVEGCEELPTESRGGSLREREVDATKQTHIKMPSVIR